MANIRSIPPVTLNLIIINCAVLLLQTICEAAGVDITSLFGLNFFLADNFRLWQLGTYMFLHGGISHLFFNMFALWMFGVVIETTLGARRFLAYYLFCGVGAGICQELWQLGQYYVEGLAQYDQAQVGTVVMSMSQYLNHWITVGASGACYGVLLAFGVLYPEQRIMLLIPPIPMKAKYFVCAYAVIELLSAFSSSTNIAHFAHLGGMLFGWALLHYWRKHPARSNRWQYGQEEKPTILQRIRNVFDYERRAAQAETRRRASSNPDHDYNLQKKQREARLDEILDKIKKSGYDSLSAKEKQELFQYSK